MGRPPVFSTRHNFKATCILCTTFPIMKLNIHSELFAYLYQFAYRVEISHCGGNAELLFQIIVTEFASAVRAGDVHVGRVFGDSKFFITKVTG